MAHHEHHEHHEHHRHHHDNGQDVVHQNQEYFNKEATTYDTRHVQLLQRIDKEIRGNKDFIGVDWSTAAEKSAAGADVDGTAAAPPVRLLDYACGTGAMSRMSIDKALGNLVDECVGIDISPQMVEIYNKRAQEEGFTREQRFAVQGNLALASDPEPTAFADFKIYNDFAIAIVGGGFHHFEHPELAAERLVQRLRPGGVLAIWDFFTHDHTDSKGHGAAHTIVKHGFSEEELREMFTKAGAGEGFQVLDLGEHAMDNRGKKITRRIFLARGQKARSVL